MEGIKGKRGREKDRVSSALCLMASSPRFGDDLLHFINLPLGTTESTELYVRKGEMLVTRSINLENEQKARIRSIGNGDGRQSLYSLELLSSSVSEVLGRNLILLPFFFSLDCLSLRRFFN